LWVHGANKARFEADYKSIAKKFKIPGFEDPETDKLILVSDWLSDEVNGTWLLVLDNVDDSQLWLEPTQGPFSTGSMRPSVPLNKFIPRGSHGFVLFTTRDIQLGKQLVKKKPLEVLPLGTSEACLLLRSKIAEDDEISQFDATVIVQTLDYLPLAITQAAAYLDQTNLTVAEYLQMLRTGKADTFDLLKEGIHDPSRDYEIQNSVFQTWKLSFQQISKQTPRAAEILSLMATLDRHAIPAALLRQAGEPELGFIGAIQKLKAFHLISEEIKISVFSIHSLVQLSVQKWLDHRKELSRWQKAALLTVSDHCPSWYKDLGAWRTIIPHIGMVLQNEFEDKACLVTRARLLTRFGRYNCRQENFEIADVQSSEAISIREKFLGPNHVRTLGALAGLGTVYWRQGKATEAEVVFLRILRYEDELGPKKTQNIVNKLGAVYYDQGRFEDAMALYQRALTRYRNSTDPLDLQTLTTLNNVANIYWRQGRLGDAETLVREVLMRKEKILGNEHPATFEPLMNLGHIYRAQGKFSEMEDMFRQALERSEKSLGLEDKNTLAAAYELYTFYTQQGRAVDSALLQKVEHLKTMPGPPVCLFCDLCQKNISASVPYYSCATCHNGDFDVCQNCVDKGLACLDRSHVLIKGRL
jgi:tetratricopeptide (TPR) repeat protein